MGRSTSSFMTLFVVWGITFFISGYFIMHGLGLGGELGYFSLDSLDRKIAQSEERLAEMTTHRQWLAHRISLVSGDTIDADFLGEIARGQGGLYATDELVIDFN